MAKCLKTNYSVASGRVVEPHCFRNWKHSDARKFGYDVYVHPSAGTTPKCKQMSMSPFLLAQIVVCVNSL